MSLAAIDLVFSSAIIVLKRSSCSSHYRLLIEGLLPKSLEHTL
jgi:hypothetical protein